MKRRPAHGRRKPRADQGGHEGGRAGDRLRGHPPGQRGAARLAELREVQLFGDRLNAVALDAQAGEQAARRALEEAGIPVISLRVIPSSLENAFISLIRSESEVAS